MVKRNTSSHFCKFGELLLICGSDRVCQKNATSDRPRLSTSKGYILLNATLLFWHMWRNILFFIKKEKQNKRGSVGHLLKKKWYVDFLI